MLARARRVRAKRAPAAAECQHCPAQRTDGERGGGGGGRAHKLDKAWYGVNRLESKGLGGVTTTKLLRDYLNVMTLAGTVYAAL